MDNISSCVCVAEFSCLKTIKFQRRRLLECSNLARRRGPKSMILSLAVGLYIFLNVSPRAPVCANWGEPFFVQNFSKNGKRSRPALGRGRISGAAILLASAKSGRERVELAILSLLAEWQNVNFTLISESNAILFNLFHDKSKRRQFKGRNAAHNKLDLTKR